MAIEFQDPEDGEDEDASKSEREVEQSEPVLGDDGEGEGADETTELDEDQEQEEVDLKPEKPSRAQSRIQTLSNSAKEAAERAAAAERRAQELEQRLSRLEKPEPVEREPTEDEMALWTPKQVMDYGLSKATKQFEQKLGAIQWQTYEQGDKAGWDSYCASNPRAKRFSEQVESELQRMRASNRNESRANIYYWLVGKDVDSKAPKQVATQRAQGQQRIARQQASGASPKGDQRRSGGKLTPQEERDKRLRDAGFYSDT